MFLDGWNESVYSISKANQPSIVLPIRKLISNDKKSYYLTKYTQMITAMRLLPIHLQSKCYPTNIKATMKQFYFYNMSFCYNDSGRGLYMESREWERIVDHLLSLVPLFIANLCFLENFLLKDICRHHIHKYYCLKTHISSFRNRQAASDFTPNMTPLLNKLIQEELIERHYSEKIDGSF